MRGGLDIPGWQGINRQEDPGAIPDGAFQDLVNVRHKGTKLIDRPGLTKINSSAVTGEVKGMFDPLLNGGFGGDAELQEISPAIDCDETSGYGTEGSRLYWLGYSACSGEYGLLSFSPDQSPTVQFLKLPPYQDGVASHDSIINVSVVNGIWSDGEKLWCHAGYGSPVMAYPATYVLQTLGPRHFSAPPSTVVSLALAEAAGNAGGTVGKSGQCDFANKHFWTSGGVSEATQTLQLHVWAFDGLTNTLEESSSVLGVATLSEGIFATSIGVLNEELIYCVAGAITFATLTPGWTIFRKRSLAGAWSTVSLPAGVLGFSSSMTDPAVYKGKIYFLGYGQMPAVNATGIGGIVISYNGTALVDEHQTILSATSGTGGIYSFRNPVVFNGYLYYLHTPDDNSAKLYVGRYDGTTWIDTHKDLMAQFEFGSAVNAVWMRLYRGKLYVGIQTATIGTDFAAILAASPGTNVSGTWTTEATGTLNLESGTIFSPQDLEYQYWGFSSAVL